jgi:hypothetical protein
MLLDLADKRKPTPFILKKRISKQNFLLELQLNAMRKDE